MVAKAAGLVYLSLSIFVSGIVFLQLSFAISGFRVDLEGLKGEEGGGESLQPNHTPTMLQTKCIYFYDLCMKGTREETLLKSYFSLITHWDLNSLA